MQHSSRNSFIHKIINGEKNSLCCILNKHSVYNFLFLCYYLFFLASFFLFAITFPTDIMKSLCLRQNFMQLFLSFLFFIYLYLHVRVRESFRFSLLYTIHNIACHRNSLLKHYSLFCIITMSWLR